jgi:uncharacterized membrane protein YoaK (UPF0700 family)
MTMPGLVLRLRGGWLLPFVLSTTAGAVDVTGFLALDGLFTAHITGNLVVLAVHYTTGGFCAVGPLLAVPVYVAVLGAVTLVSKVIEKSPSRRALLVMHAALLAGSLGLGAGFGPFTNADTTMAVLVGMFGVAAMATQSALVRLTLPGTPSTAVMTTNITQLAVDLATLAQRRGESGERALARHRARATLPCILGFITGCAAGAVLEVHCGLWALALPATLAVIAVPLGELWSDIPAMAQPRVRHQLRSSTII